MGGFNFPPLVLFLLIGPCRVMGFSSKSNRGLNGELLRKEKEMKWVFSEWQVKFDKSYDHPTEESRRFQIFKSNLRYISEHNRPENNHSFSLGLNQFADLTAEDFANLYLINQPDEIPMSEASDRYEAREDENLPSSVDWRIEGAVNPVENQGRCAACWAFAAAGAIEGINQIINGELLTLSKQNLMDCDFQSSGCHGDSPVTAYKFVQRNGIDSESHYPYQGAQQSCNRSRESVLYIDGYEVVKPSTEKSLQKAVSNQPVSTLMEANSTDFMFYKKGIFDGTCGRIKDHVVLVVGYGSKNGMDYWIVKNSWGKMWGENGYVRIIRGPTTGYFGKCHIASSITYPVIDRPYTDALKSHGEAAFC